MSHTFFSACNVLSVSTTDPFTLRNYGRRINCTLIAIYPGTVQVIALGVGGTSSHGVSHMTETGTLHKVCRFFSIYIYCDIIVFIIICIHFQCDTKSPQDQVQIGGSRDLDTTKLDVIDSICGIDSKPGKKYFTLVKS